MSNKILKIAIVILFLVSSSFSSLGYQDDIIKENIKNITHPYFSLDFPSDFNLKTYCGGFEPWTEIYILEINSNGEGAYYILYPENRTTGTFTLISEFDVSNQELDLLWLQITNNDFFSLDTYYEQDGVYSYGGTFANLTITGNGVTNTVHSVNMNLDNVDNIVKTINTLTPGENDLIYNALFNHVPFIPDKPTGKVNGSNKQEYEYETSSSDLDDDALYFMFDWGDGTTSDWQGPYESSEQISLKHTWEKKGNYNIKVKAIDDPNNDGDLSDGEESNWSEPLPVSMAKSKQKNILFFISFLKKFFQQHLSNQNKITQNIQPHFQVVNCPTTDDGYDENSGTRAKYENCKITIEWHIIVYGDWVDQHLFDDVLWDAIDKMENDMESKWNRDQWDQDGDGKPDGKEPWRVPCKSDCEEHEPGCTVKFEANIDADSLVDDEDIPKGGNANDKQKQGHHYIHLNGPEKPRGAYINAWGPNKNLPAPNNGMETTGEFNANDQTGVWAHEAGHLSGLQDEYIKIQIPTIMGKPIEIFIPLSDSIMAHPDNWPTQEDINEIVESSGIECPCDCCPEENDTQEPENKITHPQEQAKVTATVTVQGIASDYVSGVAKLDYQLEWDGGSYEGNEYPIDPPLEYISYELGPINLENYIQPGDWITITTYATDAAGNTGEDSVTVTWVEDEDTIPPVTEKIIGEPNEEGGYIIWPGTPIWLNAVDDGGSGVDYIYYEIAWDTNEDGVYDELFEETIYQETAEIHMQDYGILNGLIELRWYAVDNANNTEDMHYQQHLVAN